MMKIAYDHGIFHWQKYGGISRYIYELSSRLFDHSDLDVKIVAGAYVNEHLKQAPSGLVAGFPVAKTPGNGRLLKYFNKIFSAFWFNSYPAEVVHETFYSVDRVAPKRSKVVLTIHDLIAEKFYPDDAVVQARAIAIQRADHLICISENTKQDVIELLDVEPHKISVIYHGCSLGMSPSQAQQPDTVAQQPYILYVGDRFGYKNFDRLLDAFANSRTLKKDFKLICFGGFPNFSSELATARDLGLPEGSLLQVSGNDALLETFYRGASAFVYPSMYEGFGMPLLEAMALDCPVACSNTSCLPEVVGDAAELFNPYDRDSITNALEAVVYSSARSHDLIQRGRERAALFSWDRCAEQTRNVYLSLV